MGLLEPANESSYLKAAFYGEGGSGKTHTAMLLAEGVRREFKLDGPIAMYDTERGSDYISKRVKESTGKSLLVRKSRSMPELLSVAEECIDGGVSVLIVDSVTHVWREVCDSYLEQLQKAAQAKKWRVPDALEFQDWSRIKAKWARWTDVFLNSPLHIIVCGRLGHDYEQETNDRGKKTMVKAGTKMKAEKEFQYEPGLLVEFEHDFDDHEPPTKIVRARVMKDRFDLINGKECEFPTFEFFKPHIAQLNPKDHSPLSAGESTAYELDETRSDDWAREKDRREIMAEKIKAAMALAGFEGQSGEDKKKRAEELQKFFGSTSWKEISEKTPSMRLAEGLFKLEQAHGLDASRKSDEIPF
jgi:AAA domain